MRQLWTDDELDQALAELHADVRPTPNGLAAARERVLAGEPVRSRRFHRVWLPIVAAAAVVALVSTVLVLLPHTAQPAAPPSPKPPLPEPVPVSLTWILNNITYSDPTVAPGQFRYVRDQVLAGGASGDPSKPLTDQTTTTWQPAKWTDQWLRRETVLGNQTVKTEGGQIVAAGPEQTFSMHDMDVRAGCADFDSVNPQTTGHLPCVDQKGSWLTPTPDWLASLPKDPEALAAKLKADTPNGVGPLYMAIYALKTGVFPADIRLMLYNALTYLPGAYGLKDVANLDGKVGFAIGVIKQRVADVILIDPGDGTYLGVQQYEPDNSSVFLFSAMRYGVVDSQGATPK